MRFFGLEKKSHINGKAWRIKTETFYFCFIPISRKKKIYDQNGILKQNFIFSIISIGSIIQQGDE